MATTFTNQATLSYNGATVRSNVTVGVLEGTLSVTKTAVQSAYTVGDVITYVIAITNSGDAPVVGLTVTDDLGAYPFGADTLQPLTYVDGTVQYYADGVLQPAPAVTTTDGLTIADVTVPAQGSTTLVYAAKVNAFAPLAAGSAITNTVAVSGADVSTVEAQETVPVNDSAQLSMLKTVSPVPVSENGRLTYTFQLQNNGTVAVIGADDAIVSDVFDPVLSDVSVWLDGTLLAPADYTYDEITGTFATTAGVIAVPAAVSTQDPVTGEWTTVPGSTTLTVAGNVGTL